MTYSQLDEEVNKLCHWLTQKGFGKGDVMALYMPMTPNIVIAFFAIVKLGGVLLPLFRGMDTSHSTRLNDANARVVFAHTSSIRRGKKQTWALPCVQPLPIHHQSNGSLAIQFCQIIVLCKILASEQRLLAKYSRGRVFPLLLPLRKVILWSC